MAIIMDGKLLSAEKRREIALEAAAFLKKAGRAPGLAVVLAGADPASEIYVRNKIKACAETGIKSFAYYLPAETAEAEIIELITTLNADTNIDGILVQLPLPKTVDEKRVLKTVRPDKDVDGFHAENAGNLMLGNETLPACTPSGCIELLKRYNVPIEGANAVVIGRSNIVGKPAALLLLQENATVTICHSKTKNLADVTRRADILIAAIGRAEFVTADMVKEGAAVIDVGMNRTEKGLKGDVHFEGVSAKAAFITPVPGGVGPMTITMLMANTVTAAERLASANAEAK